MSKKKVKDAVGGETKKLKVKEKKEKPVKPVREKEELTEEDKDTLRKKTKKLIIMLIVLAVLIGAYFILKNYNAKKSAEEEAESNKTLYNTETSDVTELSYTYDGVEYTYTKDDAGNWLYTGDETLDIDEDEVETLLGYVCPLGYEAEIDAVTDFDQYGLEDDYSVIKWSTATGSYEIHVGSNNAVTDVYYFMPADGDTVYTTSDTYIATKFRVTPEDIIAEVEETEETSE